MQLPAFLAKDVRESFLKGRRNETNTELEGVGDVRESHKQALVGGSCGECAEVRSKLRCKPHLSVSHASMCSEVDGNESSLRCPGLLGV